MTKYALFHHIMHKIGLVLSENNHYGEFVKDISAIAGSAFLHEGGYRSRAMLVYISLL